METSLIICQPVYLEEKFAVRSLKVNVPKSQFVLILLLPSLVLCGSMTQKVMGSIFVGDEIMGLTITFCGYGQRPSLAINAGEKWNGDCSIHDI